jgi:prepilin-type N-terminal cleavage/methylation domain-containing protein
MKPGIFRQFHSNRAGFTLIEAIVSLCILGVIGLGASMATNQVLSQTSRNNNFVTADRQTLNALHWISCDTQMAQSLQPYGPSGFPLTLEWVEWDNTSHEVIYSIQSNQLKRSSSVNGGPPVTSLIANYINPATDLTNCVSSNGVLTLTVTGSVGQGAEIIHVTKVREITSRPNL